MLVEATHSWLLLVILLVCFLVGLEMGLVMSKIEQITPEVRALGGLFDRLPISNNMLNR